MNNTNKIIAACGGVAVLIMALFFATKPANTPEAIIDAAGEAFKAGDIEEYFMCTVPLTVEKVKAKEKVLIEKSMAATRSNPNPMSKPVVRKTITKSDCAIVIMETKVKIGETTHQHFHRQPVIKIDGRWLMASHYWTTNKELYARVKADFKAADKEAKDWIKANR